MKLITLKSLAVLVALAMTATACNPDDDKPTPTNGGNNGGGGGGTPTYTFNMKKDQAAWGTSSVTAKLYIDGADEDLIVTATHSDGSKVMIVVHNPTAKSYGLSGANNQTPEASVMYYAPGSSTPYTSTSGQLVLSAYNKNGNVAGTFSAGLILSTNPNQPMQLTEGSWTAIPVTIDNNTNPGQDGSLSCLVNNASWIAEEATVAKVAGKWTLMAYSANGQNSLYIVLGSANLQAGTYSLSMAGPNFGMFEIDENGTTLTATSGTLTISSVSNGKASGTFSMTVTGEDQQDNTISKTITQGTFTGLPIVQ